MFSQVYLTTVINHLMNTQTASMEKQQKFLEEQLVDRRREIEEELAMRRIEIEKGIEDLHGQMFAIKNRLSYS